MSKKATQSAAAAAVRAAEAVIRDVMTFVMTERDGFEQRIGRWEVLAAEALSQGADAFEVSGRKGKWADWAAGLFPGMSQKSLYRWRNAGDVARVLRGDGTEATPDILGDVPAALVGSLVPLYRVLDMRAKSDEARSAGRKLARDTYSGLLDKADPVEILDREGQPIIVPRAPLFAEVHAAAERVAPTNRGGSSDDSSDEPDGAEPPSGDEAETVRGAQPVQVDPAAVEAAAGPTDAILRNLCETHSVSRETAAACMLAALRLAGEHGVSTVQAVLASGSASSPADEPTPQDEAAAIAAAETEAAA